MKKLFLLLSALVLCLGLQAQIVASKSFIRKETSEAAKSGFSFYVEQINIFNLNNGDYYSTGVNSSFGREWNNRWYVGGGISLFYRTIDYYADVKCKILKNTIVTPVFGLKLGFGICDFDYFHIVTRPSAGVLFRLGGRHELMLNWEYVPADRNGLSLNLGYKFYLNPEKKFRTGLHH